MRIFLRVVFCVFLLLTQCMAAEIDPDRTEMLSTPAYQEYFEEYTKRLYDNYKPQKRFIKGWGYGDNFMYFIKRDGTIEHLDTFIKNDRFARYGKKVIRNTPPKPFPDEIKDDMIYIDAWIHYFKDDEYNFRLRGRSKYFASRYWKRFYDIESINAVVIHIERDGSIHLKRIK